MTTIENLSDKYGGILAEFITMCKEDGKDPEIELKESTLLRSLVSKLQRKQILTEKIARYSCSKELYDEHLNKAFETFSCLDLERMKSIARSWPSLGEKDMSSIATKAFELGRIDVCKWLKERYTGIKIDQNAFYPFFTVDRCDDIKWVLENYEFERFNSIVLKIFSYSVSNNIIEMVQWVAEKYGSIINNDWNELSRNLCIASSKGHNELVEFILKKTCLLSIFSQETLFTLHCIHSIETAKIFLDCNPTFQPDDQAILTALRHTSEKGNLQVVNWLLEKYPRDSLPFSLFFRTCCFGQLEVVQRLYNSGIPIVMKEGYDMEDLFGMVCEGGFYRMAQWLLSTEYFEDINRPAALNLGFVSACREGKIVTAKWLYSLGQITDETMRRAFATSCMGGFFQSAKWLKKLNPMLGLEGVDYFDIICHNGHINIAKWLLEMNPMINVKRAINFCQGMERPKNVEWLITK